MISAVSCKKETSRSNNLATGNEYIVLASNNPGMNGLNPSYSELTILPSYNTVQVQYLKRGDIPQIITGSVTVEFNILSDPYSFGKQENDGFWAYFKELFRFLSPTHDNCQTGTDLSGTMAASISDELDCTKCHSAIPTNTANWPLAYLWENSNK
jgi:hypothetical protein